MADALRGRSRTSVVTVWGNAHPLYANVCYTTYCSSSALWCHRYISRFVTMSSFSKCKPVQIPVDMTRRLNMSSLLPLTVDWYRHLANIGKARLWIGDTKAFAKKNPLMRIKKLNDRSLPQGLPVQKFLENSKLIGNFLSNSAITYTESKKKERKKERHF